MLRKPLTSPSSSAFPGPSPASQSVASSTSQPRSWGNRSVLIQSDAPQSSTTTNWRSLQKPAPAKQVSTPTEETIRSPTSPWQTKPLFMEKSQPDTPRPSSSRSSGNNNIIIIHHFSSFRFYHVQAK